VKKLVVLAVALALVLGGLLPAGPQGTEASTEYVAPQFTVASLSFYTYVANCLQLRRNRFTPVNL